MSNADKKTQKQVILRHLRNYGSLTTLVATKRYNICRLSERARELIKDGYCINRPRIRKNGHSITAYSLVQGKRKAA